MARIVRTEVRRRSFFGKVFKILFVIFNLLMAAWLVSYWVQIGDLMGKIDTDAGRVGGSIGATLGTGFILAFWAAGDVVLGILTLLTRGKKILIDETVE